MAKREYSEWIYQVDNDNQYSIIPDVEIEKPKTFFKYYALNENSVSALTEMYLYASHPNQLNDPFDCNKKIVQINEMETCKIVWEGLFKDLYEFYNGNEEDILKITNEAYMTKLYKKVGIISLTTSPNNRVMWSYYAKHNGFCIEIDINELGFGYKGPFPIHYTDKIEPITLDEYGGHLSMLIQTTTKTKEWERENEWRLWAYPPQGTDFVTYGERAEELNFPCDRERFCPYNILSLKSVYLGLDFYKNQIYQITKTEYEVVFNNTEQLNYKVTNFLSNPKLYTVNIFITDYDQRHPCKLCYKRVTIVKLSNLKFRIHTLQEC